MRLFLALLFLFSATAAAEQVIVGSTHTATGNTTVFCSNPPPATKVIKTVSYHGNCVVVTQQSRNRRSCHYITTAAPTSYPEDDLAALRQICQTTVMPD